MKRNFIFLFFTGCVIFLLSAAQVNAAENLDPLTLDDQYVYNQEISHDSEDTNSFMNELSNGPIRKLGRGLSNLIFGVIEIPLQSYQTNEIEGGIAAVTFGLVKGISFFIAREVVGVVEIVTFPIPLPGASVKKYDDGWGYGPLMQPEWILDFNTNPYDFVYPNYPVK